MNQNKPDETHVRHKTILMTYKKNDPQTWNNCKESDRKKNNKNPNSTQKHHSDADHQQTDTKWPKSGSLGA